MTLSDRNRLNVLLVVPRYQTYGMDRHYVMPIGILAVRLALVAKCPAETCFFPALLPMIPGMYAYRTVEALVLCLCHADEATFMHYLYLFAYNGFTCSMIVLGMVIGANIPIFLMKRLSFIATKID